MFDRWARSTLVAAGFARNTKPAIAVTPDPVNPPKANRNTVLALDGWGPVAVPPVSFCWNVFCWNVGKAVATCLGWAEQSAAQVARPDIH